MERRNITAKKCNGSGHNTTTCTATTQAKGKAGAATAKYKKQATQTRQIQLQKKQDEATKKYGGADKFIVIDEFLIDCTRLLCM